MKSKIISIISIAVLSAQSLFADKIYLLKKDKDALRARANLIESAKESIKIQVFTMEEDILTRGTIGLLTEKVKSDPKIKIQIIVDSMFNKLENSTLAIALGSLDESVRGRIEFKEYNQFNIFRPMTYLKRMHDKLFIIDNSAYIVGGRNFATDYYKIKHKTNGELDHVYEDTDAVIFESESIKEATKYFDALFQNDQFTQPVQPIKFRPEDVASNACAYDFDHEQECKQTVAWIKEQIIEKQKMVNEIVRNISQNDFKAMFNFKMKNWQENAATVPSIKFIYDNPIGQNKNLTKPENSIGQQLYYEILKVHKPVTIITPYFVLTPEHRQMFSRLQENKIPVTVITNGKRSHDQPVALYGYLKTKSEAEKLGVTFYEYNGPDTLHSKMVLMGLDSAFIGSYNWDLLSQNNNREVGIIVNLKNSTETQFINEFIDEVNYIKQRAHLVTGVKNPVVKPNQLSKTHTSDLTEQEQSELADAILTQNQNLPIWVKLLYPFLEYLNIP